MEDSPHKDLAGSRSGRNSRGIAHLTAIVEVLPGFGLCSHGCQSSDKRKGEVFEHGGECRESL